jgi:tetratricopeptide (TPR) repeat protein
LETVPGADHESIAEHQAWFAARNAFEAHRWKEAAALPIPQVPRESQESTYRVRAIAAAHLHDAASARQSLEKYIEISAEEQRKSNHHSGKAPEKSARQMAAEAWVAFAEDKPNDALKTLRAAADREDADGVDSLAMPAREMLADMLLELKHPSEALAEYKAALKNSPNRFDSLYGAGHAAQLAGDTAAANLYFTKLMEISAPTADRAELVEVKAHLASASKGKSVGAQ